MMTDDEIIAVVQAHKEGKEIEHRCKSGGIMGERWSTTRGCTPGWNFLECEYRVAPEPRKPREWWAVLDGNSETGYKGKLYEKFEDTQLYSNVIRARVREVIE